MTGKLLHLLLPSQILSIMAFNPHHHISALVPGYFCRRRQLLVNNFQTLHWTLITLLLTNGIPRDDKISEKIKDPASFKIIKLSVIVFYIIITSLRKIMDRIQYSANKLENIEKVINDLPSWPGYCYGDEGLIFQRYMVGELYESFC